MSQFNVKVRNKLDGKEWQLSVARTGMDESEVKSHVESLPGPAGSPPCFEYISHEVVGGKYNFSPGPVKAPAPPQ